MPLAVGTRLGPYAIVSHLGAGGMGEVYRAHDQSTGRFVALKVLPEEFASDSERLIRFQREAVALGSLNHPNIATIYGVEDRGPCQAIVMELVEGEDLSARIARGPVPVAEALALARQIADALTAAHDVGIVHRDLKPGNIRVRDDGVVKVLDFGLARSSDLTGSSAPAAESPTITASATARGAMLGTTAYMAPEQARGKPVDKRVDVWAFGVVLFEMLAGRRPFQGEVASDVLAAVLTLEPVWNALPADLPAPVRRLLARCLEKDVRVRLRDIAEGLHQLDDAADAPPVQTATPLWRRAFPVATAVAITAIATAAIFQVRRPAESPAQPIRFLAQGTTGMPFVSTAANVDLAFSPDGSAIVYTTIDPGSTLPSLHIRFLSQFESAPLKGGESAVGPFVSPDGHWVGFVDSQNPARLKKVELAGGTATAIGILPGIVNGATWTAQGVIVAGTVDRGLFKIPEDGGEPIALTTLDDRIGERAHRYPSAVPGTDVVLFCTAAGGSAPRLAAVNVASGKIVRFEIAGASPRYVDTGHIVFATADGTLRALVFDPGAMQVAGDPLPVLEGVSAKAGGAANFAIGRDGDLVYARGSGLLVPRTVVWVDRNGRELPTAAPPHSYFYARVSPDGRKLALDLREGEGDVWIWDVRGTMRRLTESNGTDQYAIWTPDGTRIVFQSDIKQRPGIYVTRADAIGEPTQILERAAAFPNAVTPDGKSVIFRATSSTTKNDLFVMAIDGPERPVTPLLQTPHDELNAALSPDGKWMAFESDATGRFEIYVRSYPDIERVQEVVSTAGGSEPVWGLGGRELFYVGADNKLHMVAVTAAAGGKASFSAPVALFDTRPYFFGGLGRNYDISNDGKRFAMIKDDQTKAPAPDSLRIVLHWTEELKAIRAR